MGARSLTGWPPGPTLGAVAEMNQTVNMGPGNSEDLLRSVRTMIIARWVAAPWAFIQVMFYEVPYPAGYEAMAYGLAMTLIVCNLGLWWLHRGPGALGRSRALAIAGLGLDIALLSGFVWLFAFDYDTQVWALLFIAPLEGAIMFQLTGALTTWAVIAVSYAARDVWAAEQYGNPLLWNSVSFRMGIGGIIALVAGLMARDLMRQRSKLAEALEEIKRIDRMRSGLVSMLGHDVRSPLTVIRGVVETLLSRDDVEQKDRLALLESADRQARRLERLANDLLDLARLDQGRMELETAHIDVESAVKDALTYVEGTDTVRIDVEEGLTMLGDPRRFEQVVINLATNALNHGRPPIEIIGTVRDGQASLEISDHGKGVDEAQLARLFEPFSTKRESGSIGYGLAIVKALIEAQHGTVTYEQNEQGGARFRVSLPRA